MAEQGSAVSLNPSDAIAGGLLDDVTVRWDNPHFEMYDYDGKVATAVPALGVTLVDVDTDEATEQYWSMGQAKDWAPSEDGSQLVSVGSATQLRSSSNGMIMLTSLLNAGFPPDKLGTDISDLDGLVAHMIRVDAPKRTGLAKAKKKGDDGREYTDTILTVDEIVQLPWEKKKPKGAPGGKKKTGGKAKAKGKAKGKAAAAADTSNDEAVEEAQAFILELLADAGDDGIPKRKLPTLVFQKRKDHPLRNAIVKLIGSEDFFTDSDLWAYEDGVITPAE